MCCTTILLPAIANLITCSKTACSCNSCFFRTATQKHRLHISFAQSNSPLLWGQYFDCFVVKDRQFCFVSDKNSCHSFTAINHNNIRWQALTALFYNVSEYILVLATFPKHEFFIIFFKEKKKLINLFCKWWLTYTTVWLLPVAPLHRIHRIYNTHWCQFFLNYQWQQCSGRWLALNMFTSKLLALNMLPAS